MAVKISTGLRNAILDSGLQAVFDSGILEIRSATRPADADTAPAGTVLASITLPADAFAAASAGAIAKSGTWQDASADATGTAAWFRFKQSGDLGTTNATDERLDGDVGTSGSDMNLDNTSIASTQQVTISTGSITLPAS